MLKEILKVPLIQRENSYLSGIRSYIVETLTKEGAAWLVDLDGDIFVNHTNADKLKNVLLIGRRWGLSLDR